MFISLLPPFQTFLCQYTGAGPAVCLVTIMSAIAVPAQKRFIRFGYFRIQLAWYYRAIASVTAIRQALVAGTSGTADQSSSMGD